jgi:toxic protein SymE
MAKQIRRAKVHALYRPGVVRWGRNYNTGKNVPWLNVNGLWLEQAGFTIGDQIEINVSRNRLVIKKLSADGDH